MVNNGCPATRRIANEVIVSDLALWRTLGFAEND